MAIQFTKIGSVEALAAWTAQIDELELKRRLPQGAIRVLSSVDSAHLSLDLCGAGPCDAEDGACVDRRRS